MDTSAKALQATEKGVDKPWADQMEDELNGTGATDTQLTLAEKNNRTTSHNDSLQVTAITDATHTGVNFTIRDQDGNDWFIPRSRINLKIDGIGTDGQLRFSGTAPIEYSWYPFSAEEQAEMEAARNIKSNPESVTVSNKRSELSGNLTVDATEGAPKNSNSTIAPRAYKPWTSPKAKRPTADRKGKGKDV